MKNIVFLLFTFAFIGSLLAGEVSGTRLILNTFPEKNTFKVGQKVYLKFTIKNDHDFPVYVLIINSDIGIHFFDSKTKDQIANNEFHCAKSTPIVTKDSFILIKPGECYTNTAPSPILINESTNETYRLEFDHYTYPIPEYGFIVNGALYSCDYPVEHLKDIDEFKGLDYSVPLFRKGTVYSEVEIINDGNYFRIKDNQSTTRTYRKNTH